MKPFLTGLLLLLLGLCPPAGAAPEPPAASVDGRYQVQPGDSLYGIARQAGISVAELKRLNGLRGDLIKPGQALATREPAAPPAAGKPAATPAVSGEHRVGPGETLYGIARQAGISVAELKRRNGLSTDLIRPGQILRTGSTGTEAQAEPLPEPPAEPAAAAGDAGVASVGGRLEQVTGRYLAIPYRFGAGSRSATDCSGFVQQVFHELEVELPRSAREQYRLGAAVSLEDLQPGDLLFYRTYAQYPSHVGIYLGEGKMIHASRVHRKVVISDIGKKYFRSRFIGAKRVASFDPDLLGLEAPAGQLEEVNEEGLLEAEADQAGLEE